MRERRTTDHDVSAQSRFIEAGGMMVASAPMTLATVLGTAVGVCLWNRQTRTGGLAHYTYPVVRDPRQATARYGNAAIPHLIRLMTEGRATSADLVAHLLGGAAKPPDGNPDLAKRNIALAERLLAKQGIRILSRDVGGDLGRKIVFDVATGHIAVLKVERLRSGDWYGDG